MYNGVTIKSVDQCSDHGVLRTSDFQYNAHIDMICPKASTLSGMATKLFMCRGREFFTLVHQRYIRPRLEYALAAWFPLLTWVLYFTLDQLERIQRRFTRRLVIR